MGEGVKFGEKANVDEIGERFVIVHCLLLAIVLSVLLLLAIVLYVLLLQLPMQSVPITTDVVSSNLDQGEVYNIM